MNTKEVCAKLDVTPKMLRVYESQGLLKAGRGENNYRNYDTDDMLKIQLILMLKKLGLSLKDIKRILDAKISEDKHLMSLYLQMKTVETQIENLQAVHGKLTNTINNILKAGELKLHSDIMTIAEYIGDDPEERYKELLRKWDFDEMAADYVGRYLMQDKEYLAAMEKIAAVITPMEGSFVDIGAGTCNLWEKVKGEKDLLVVDKSLQMVLAGKEKIPWARFAIEDILNTERIKKMEIFDVVVSTFTLHHIPYEWQRTALANLFLLCEKGGRVIIVDRCFRNSAHKEQIISALRKENDTKGIDRIIYEFYLYMEDIENWVVQQGGTVEKLFEEGETAGFVMMPRPIC